MSRNRAQHIIALLAEEEMPVDQDPNWLEPKRIGGVGAPRPQSDHYPTKGIGGIPTGSPNAQERKEAQNTFPWNGEQIRNVNQLHIYAEEPQSGGFSGVGGVTN